MFVSGERFEGGERSKGEGDSLRRLREFPKISEIFFVETRITKLASEMLRSLEVALGELDIGTIKHSLGTAVLVVVLIAQLKDSAGELRGAQAVTTGDQQSEVPATEKIKEFWSRLNEHLRGGFSTSSEVASTSSQTEVSTTPESRVLELWNVLLRYLPLFLLFLLLHDYGKRFISDIVNSEVRFSDAQKKLAQQVLDELIRKSSNREALNRQFLPSSPDKPNNLRQQLLNLFGKWAFEVMAATILSASSPEKTSSEQGLASESLGRVSFNLQELLASFKINLPNLGCGGTVPENDAEMVFWWLLILCHPAHGFLDVAVTIINQLGQSNDLSSEDKAYIIAIAIGVIAGHHTPGGDSGYSPVDVLVKVLKHCLEHLGLGVNSNYLQQAQVDSNYLEQAKDLMLFAAALSKIIDVMQARCFDERAYNQNVTRPLPTELKFESQKPDTGGAELQKRMDEFLKSLYDWICKKAFSGLNELDPDGHSTVSVYDLIYQAILNQRIPDSEQSLASASNPTRINYGSIINDLSLTLGILSR